MYIQSLAHLLTNNHSSQFGQIFFKEKKLVLERCKKSSNIMVLIQQRTVKTAESYLVEDYKNYNIQFLKVLLLSLNLILLCQNDLDRSFYDLLLFQYAFIRNKT
jgi:hypothetical protein